MQEKPKDLKKLMDILEFIDSGFLQELNRRVLHPAGLELIVKLVAPGEKTSSILIVDNRDAPGGIIYDLENIPDKDLKVLIKRAANVENELQKRRTERLFLYGRIVQTLKKCVGMLNFKGLKDEKEPDNK
ncbi:MAG: hypothetical protein KAS66_00170 [Candidatus Omnitrophica bacterium]|nr:hypothetical protein [Candidatus Omnitrophota bacterium]